MGLDVAYNKAVESMTRIDPRVASYASGVEFDDGSFVIPLFNLIYAVKFPECDISEIETRMRVPRVLEILLMHYLTHADGTALSGIWINYRELPGAKLFGQKFENLVSQPMLEMFHADVDSFRKAAEGLGGRLMDGIGDVAFVFRAFPRFPVACVLNIGDDEMPPSMNILFDKTAPNYLPTEDITILCGIMLSKLRKSAKVGYRKMS